MSHTPGWVAAGALMGLSNADVRQLYRQSGKQTPAEFESEPEVKKRAEKFGRVKKELDGIVFDSTLEARAYAILKLWERSGAIIELERQREFVLQEGFRDEQGKWRRPIRMKLDFCFRYSPHHNLTCVDAKGITTADWSVKAKLLRHKFPHITLDIWDKEKIKQLERSR